MGLAVKFVHVHNRRTSIHKGFRRAVPPRHWLHGSRFGIVQNTVLDGVLFTRTSFLVPHDLLTN